MPTFDTLSMFETLVALLWSIVMIFTSEPWKAARPAGNCPAFSTGSPLLPAAMPALPTRNSTQAAAAAGYWVLLLTAMLVSGPATGHHAPPTWYGNVKIAIVGSTLAVVAASSICGTAQDPRNIALIFPVASNVFEFSQLVVVGSCSLSLSWTMLYWSV